MTQLVHLARQMPFDDLLAGLQVACADGQVYRRPDPAGGLALYIYAPKTIFERLWTPYTMVARGLIVDEAARQVVATPFPKFFNLGEQPDTLPDLPFETFEKLDGSLIIAFHHGGRWRAATKGAFDSDQALWAQAQLDAADRSLLVPGTTYLFEAVHPANRIVVRYADPALVLLAAFDAAGIELPSDAITELGPALGWRAARRHKFESLADLVAHTDTLPQDDEGFVIRYADGLRLKLKGAEYRRIHALISRCTPIAMWEAMTKGDDLQAIRRDLPEEFWTDFDAITSLLAGQLSTFEARVQDIAASVAHLSDKELGLTLKDLPADVRPYIFGYRKHGFVGRVHDAMLRAIRPGANQLPGYVPSYALGRAMEEALG